MAVVAAASFLVQVDTWVADTVVGIHLAASVAAVDTSLVVVAAIVAQTAAGSPCLVVAVVATATGLVVVASMTCFPPLGSTSLTKYEANVRVSAILRCHWV